MLLNNWIKWTLQGCDCLGYIKYFDAHFTNFTGGVETIENCVCLHEEDHGILWKHQDWRTGLAEVRRSRRLSVSFVCTVANYEYGFFWHFYQASQSIGGIICLLYINPWSFSLFLIVVLSYVLCKALWMWLWCSAAILMEKWGCFQVRNIAVLLQFTAIFFRVFSLRLSKDSSLMYS
jgi:hypothetical protein